MGSLLQYAILFLIAAIIAAFFACEASWAQRWEAGAFILVAPVLFVISTVAEMVDEALLP